MRQIDCPEQDWPGRTRDRPETRDETGRQVSTTQRSRLKLESTAGVDCLSRRQDCTRVLLKAWEQLLVVLLLRLLIETAAFLSALMSCGWQPVDPRGALAYRRLSVRSGCSGCSGQAAQSEGGPFGHFRPFAVFLRFLGVSLGIHPHYG